MQTPPDDDLVVPDQFGEVIGWRAWDIVGTLALPRLQSVTHKRGNDSIWPTRRWFEAECSRGHGKGEIPMLGCGCGLYAARDRNHLVQLAYGAYGNREVKAIGEVAFAGKVIEGAQGWRAARGRIKSLLLPYEYWQWVEPLSDAYGVEAELGFLFSDQDRHRALEAERKALERARMRSDTDELVARQAEALAEYQRHKDEYERRQRGDR